MRGGLRDGNGAFFADEIFDRRPIKARFRWSEIAPRSARWEQAFFADAGTTWQVNRVMDFARDGA